MSVFLPLSYLMIVGEITYAGQSDEEMFDLREGALKPNIFGIWSGIRFSFITSSMLRTSVEFFYL